MIFFIFYQVNNLFLHQSYLKSPLPAVKLTWWKMKKNIFIIEKILKITSSAQLYNGDSVEAP